MARILLAEDDDGVRSFVSRALEIAGHEVLVAEDGGLAAERLDAVAGQVDLLLSDIKMPVLDGIALAQMAAGRYPGLKILLMTGFADQRERANGLDAVVYDVVGKPFTLAGLIEKVEDALAGKPVEIISLASQL